MSTIRLLITGGTIDKQYDESNGNLRFVESQMHEMLTQGRCTIDIVTEQLMLIDSSEICDKDRDHIGEACKSSEESRIIITHGTDTMPETARYLAQHQIPKTIVLTGAMRPYSFSRSDAPFNLGCAIAAVQTLEQGVYITMNGQIFPADRVRKNFEKGQFEWL